MTYSIGDFTQIFLQDSDISHLEEGWIFVFSSHRDFFFKCFQELSSSKLFLALPKPQKGQPNRFHSHFILIRPKQQQEIPSRLTTCGQISNLKMIENAFYLLFPTASFRMGNTTLKGKE